MRATHNQNTGATLMAMALMASKMYDMNNIGLNIKPSIWDFANYCMSNKARVRRYKKMRGKK